MSLKCKMAFQENLRRNYNGPFQYSSAIRHQSFSSTSSIEMSQSSWDSRWSISSNDSAHYPRNQAKYVKGNPSSLPANSVQDPGRSYKRPAEKSTNLNRRSYQSSSSASSSGNESSQSLLIRPPQPGMTGIATWLKSLRLHKYTRKFEGMPYEQLMTLTAKKLKTMGFTDGASNKMIACIAELIRRPVKVRDLYEGLLVWVDIQPTMEDLEQMMETPIKMTRFPCRNLEHVSCIEDFDKDDITGRITFVIQRALEVWKNAESIPEVEDERVTDKLFKVMEKCMRHEASYGGVRKALTEAMKELYSLRQLKKNDAGLLERTSNRSHHDGAIYGNTVQKTGDGRKILLQQTVRVEKPPKPGPISQVIAANRVKKAMLAMKQGIVAKHEKYEATNIHLLRTQQSCFHREPVRCMFDFEQMWWWWNSEDQSGMESGRRTDQDFDSLTEMLTLRVTELGLGC